MEKKEGKTNLGEHRQDIGQRLDERHADFVGQLGVPALQVVDDKVV